jgi:hypothetical protein
LNYCQPIVGVAAQAKNNTRPWRVGNRLFKTVTKAVGSLATNVNKNMNNHAAMNAPPGKPLRAG